MTPPPATTPPQRYAQLAVIALFLAGIALPLADMVLDLDSTEPSGENRKLAPFPKIGLSPATLAQFPADFKRYLEDNFGFRNTLVRWHAILKVRLLGVSSSQQVVLGKQGWLYYADHGVIDDYRCTDPFTQEELDRWLRTIEARRQWLEERGIRFVMVIAPNKHTIYPEYLPDSINRVGNESRIDQLIDYVRKHSKMTLVDVRPALRQAKPRHRLYHRTDTHWNEIGGLIAQNQIAQAMAPWFDAIRPLSFDEYDIITLDQPGLDLTGMLGGISDLFREKEGLYLVPHPPRKPFIPVGERDHPKIVTERSNPQLPRGIIFCDSFTEALMPFLSEQFQRLVYVRRENFDTKLIEEEQPDVVIHQILERLFMRPPPKPVRQIKAASPLWDSAPNK